MILPLVEKSLNEVSRVKREPKVFEIGAGNGDVIAYLARKYPRTGFVGVDLSVRNAESKHQLPNLRFLKGYALELLENGAIVGDILFSSSTFSIFTPKEVVNYLVHIKKNGFTRIVISDPITFGMRHTNDDSQESLNMDLYMWWHNYAGYLRKHGYEVRDFAIARFSYSWNPEARVILIRGVL